MANSNQVTTSHKARLSKLISKRAQLEQLLRKRERLSYQIKVLQKSISKEQKRVMKEEAIFEQIQKGDLPSAPTLIQELAVAKSEDLEEVSETLPLLRKELDEVLTLLLKYGEKPEN